MVGRGFGWRIFFSFGLLRCFVGGAFLFRIALGAYHPCGNFNGGFALSFPFFYGVKGGLVSFFSLKIRVALLIFLPCRLWIVVVVLTGKMNLNIF